mgnify:CR=1 FL=1
MLGEVCPCGTRALFACVPGKGAGASADQRNTAVAVIKDCKDGNWLHITAKRGELHALKALMHCVIGIGLPGSPFSPSAWLWSQQPDFQRAAIQLLGSKDKCGNNLLAMACASLLLPCVEFFWDILSTERAAKKTALLNTRNDDVCAVTTVVSGC